ncbi:hypothetical protein Gpo141_00001004 [Globisporangium polare]
MINKMDFPLKVDFFPQVRLSSDEKQKYLRTVEASAIALRRSLDKGDWKKLFDKEGVAFSKLHTVTNEVSPPAQTRASGRNGGNGSGGRNGAAQACIAVCATIYTSGTISEVLEAIASPVTEDYRRAMKFIYKTRFLDGLGLHTIVPNGGASNPQAFTTIKWAAFDDGKARNNPKFPVGSDYCFLEHSGIQRDEPTDNNHNNNENDEVFGFSIQESIVREREVPSLAGFGLRRGEFRRSGIIILPTDRRDVVQVSSILQMSLLGSDSAANKAALERLMLRRVEAIGRIDVLLERRRLSKMQFIDRDEWVADEDRKSCAVCIKPFNIRRRHHCRNCGEVVCSACAPPREVDVSSYGSALIRICTACVVQARSEPQLQNGGSQDVFVYHIRSTLSSRTSTNSSNLNGDDDGAAVAPATMTGPASTNATRSYSFCSDDSNFSIASEYPTQQSGAGAPVVYAPMYQQQQEQQVQPMTLFSSELLNDEYEDDEEDDYEDNNYYIRDSQSSSGSSSYSFSDYNTYDDRFGSAIMKRLPQPQASQSSALRASNSGYNRYSHSSNNNSRSSYSNNNNNSRSSYSNDFGGRTSQSLSSSKHVLYQHQQPEVVQTRAAAPAPTEYKRERSVYNPAKVVTHLLNLSNQDDEEEEESKQADEPQAPTPTVPSNRDDSLDSLGDFDECIRGLQEDIFRATTTARFSDLEPAGDSFSSDLASFHSDLLLSSSSDPLASTASAPPFAPLPAPVSAPARAPVLSSPLSRPQRSASTCSSPSTVDVDIDMLTSDSFSLICPDTLQRQRRSSSAASSRKQEAGETRRTRVSSLSRCSGNSVFDDDDLEDEENEDSNAGNDGYEHEDEGAANQDGDECDEDPESAMSLQSQADLEALRLQVQGLHRSLEDATSKLNYYQSRSERSRRSQRRGSGQSATSNTSSSSSARSGGGGRSGDPVLAKRSETYDALVSELHEIMGLPTLSPRGRASRTAGFWT